MKLIAISAFVLTAALMSSSCGHDSADSGRSTAVDSTNIQGQAPVQYQAGEPELKVDTSMQTETREIKNENEQRGTTNTGNGANGNGANTSNTTDKTTTAGSANNGDADKDRKK